MKDNPLSWLEKAKKEMPQIENEIQFNNSEKNTEFDKSSLASSFAPSYLFIKETETRGLGVFSKKDFEKDEVIENCHSIILNWRRKYHNDRSIFQYAYWHNCPCQDCSRDGPIGLIPLGFGCVYNCSESESERNTNFKINLNAKIITFMASKKIKAGEEILTWWGQDYYNSWCKNEK